MNNRSLIILSVSALLVFAFIAFALADDNNSANSTTPTVKNWTSICDKINDRVANTIQEFDSGQIRRLNSFNNTESMIQKLINKLGEKGANTTQAELDYQDLQLKVDQFSSDYALFITKLEGLKAFTCGNSSGQFAQALRDSKSLLPTLRNDSVQIREAVLQIRIDLLQSRGELVAVKTGQRLDRLENRTNNRTENIENKIKNRTENIENRIANRTSEIENRIKRFQNRTK